MPHSFVVAQFNPQASAYWLPPSGRLAVAKIPTVPFWAIRFNLDMTAGQEQREQTRLSVISSQPSPIQLHDSSFTIGPKQPCARDDEPPAKLSCTDAQLTVRPPLRSSPEDLDRSLYVHTVPIINLSWQHMPPIQHIRHQLDERSLLRFKEAANNIYPLMSRYCDASHAAEWRARLHSEIHSLWSTYTGQKDPTAVNGELGNPRRYAFDFHYGPPPRIDTEPTIFGEILLYADVCKDYRWFEVEGVIAWVRATRQLERLKTPSNFLGQGPKARVLLKHDTRFRDILFGIAAVLFRAERDPSNPGSPRAVEPEDGVDDWEMPEMHPTVADSYPRIGMDRQPRVVVFDVFGTILDREDAIRRAIIPWLTIACRPRRIEDAVKLYIELEALAAREKLKRATSLPTTVYSALNALASKLGVAALQSSTPGFIADAAACILRPRMYPDVPSAVAQLVQLGCIVVLLAPNSLHTYRFLCATLPRAVLQHVRTYPVPLSVHYFTRAGYFIGLQSWCRETLQLPGLAPGEILVASTGVGRVIACASLCDQPTALVRRPGNIEAAVHFLVGKREFHNPAPTVEVGGLKELCVAVRRCWP